MRRSAALLILTLTASCGRQSPADDPPATAEPAGFQQARVAVLARLKDPDSARFGPLSDGRPGVVCGSVNARNSMNGYTGMRAFAWSADRTLIYSDAGDWGDKGDEARAFGEMGCSIGPDQQRALEAARALDASERRITSGK